jgi:hypothetical protein
MESGLNALINGLLNLLNLVDVALKFNLQPQGGSPSGGGESPLEAQNEFM